MTMRIMRPKLVQFSLRGGGSVQNDLRISARTPPAVRLMTLIRACHLPPPPPRCLLVSELHTAVALIKVCATSLAVCENLNLRERLSYGSRISDAEHMCISKCQLYPPMHLCCCVDVSSAVPTYIHSRMEEYEYYRRYYRLCCLPPVACGGNT